MKLNKKSKIGIIGGMGPLATIDLYKKILEETNAVKDQDHIHVYIDINTEIPDRTAAILDGKESPVKELVRSAVKLESMGADYLVMACNTAHVFFDDVQKYVKIPLINLIDETVNVIVANKIKKIALLGTTGTILSKIYQHKLEKKEIEVILPDKKELDLIMKIIYDVVKADKPNIFKTEFKEMLNRMISTGAEAFILGCTELPIIYEKCNIQCTYFDPTRIIAKRLVDLSLNS